MFFTESKREPFRPLDRIPDRVPVDSVWVEDLEAAEVGCGISSRWAPLIALVTGPLALRKERRRLPGYRQTLRSGAPACHWRKT
jgi:hypothetical protein